MCGNKELKLIVFTSQAEHIYGSSIIKAGASGFVSKKQALSELDQAILNVFNNAIYISESLAKQVLKRVGQCILTTPTTACFSGLETDEKINLGNAIRYFGDGFQISKRINNKKFWRIPVMEGEFIIEDKTSITSGIGGGNILIIGTSNKEVLKAGEAAVKEMKKIDNIILPFPGGIVRSGSKVGSKYKNLIASTNDAYCPTLKGITKTNLDKDIECVLEIVVDGINEKDIALAMKKGTSIICKKFNKGIKSISAGNYGGKLGPFHFHLRDIMK